LRAHHAVLLLQYSIIHNSITNTILSPTTTTFFQDLVMSKSARDAGRPTSIRLNQLEETRAHIVKIIPASTVLDQEDV
jgi:hypothetical protein